MITLTCFFLSLITSLVVSITLKTNSLQQEKTNSFVWIVLLRYVQLDLLHKLGKNVNKYILLLFDLLFTHLMKHILIFYHFYWPNTDIRHIDFLSL